MTHTYIIDGMTCQGCAAKVKSKLLMQPDVLAVDIDPTFKMADITMQKHLSVNALQHALGDDAKYKIREEAHTGSAHTTKMPEAASTQGWFETYKPLVVIGAFILGVSLLTARGSLHLGMNNFMAGFFLVFSFFKLLDLKGFSESYSNYDLLAKRLPAYGYVYPFLELALGIAYLTGFEPVVTNWLTVGLMGFSSIGVIQSVLNKQKIRCACLGAVFNLPMSTVTIIEDLVMVGMAGVMILWMG